MWVNRLFKQNHTNGFWLIWAYLLQSRFIPHKPSFGLRLSQCVMWRPHQVSVVSRTGALLSHAHTETGQAAIFVFRAEMESSRLTGGARWAFNIHLQHSIKRNKIWGSPSIPVNQMWVLLSNHLAAAHTTAIAALTSSLVTVIAITYHRTGRRRL